MNSKQRQLEEVRRQQELALRNSFVNQLVEKNSLRHTRDDVLGWIQRNTGHGGFDAWSVVHTFGKGGYRHLSNLVKEGMLIRREQGHYVLRSALDFQRRLNEGPAQEVLCAKEESLEDVLAQATDIRDKLLEHLKRAIERRDAAIDDIKRIKAAVRLTDPNLSI